MTYRPQYAYDPAPPGYVDEEFTYFFSALNTPALNIIPSNRIPLQLQPDAEYRIRGIQISGNLADFIMRLWDTSGNQLSETLIEADLAYVGTLNANNPVGRLPVPFEPEIVCPAGSVLLMDIDLA